MSKDFWMGMSIGLAVGFLSGIMAIMVMGALLPTS